LLVVLTLPAQPQDAFYDDLLLQEGTTMDVHHQLELSQGHDTLGHLRREHAAPEFAALDALSLADATLFSGASSACASRGISAASSPGTSPLSTSAAMAAAHAALAASGSRRSSLDSSDTSKRAAGSDKGARVRTERRANKKTTKLRAAQSVICFPLHEKG
jgi:hypothetical protein